MLGYGQRTADGRIAWGGLGAPYWWRSGVPPSPMSTSSARRSGCGRCSSQRFPVLADVGVTHHWGGVLGVPRDLRPGVGFDRSTGLAWAGGYGGAGVAAVERGRPDARRPRDRRRQRPRPPPLGRPPVAPGNPSRCAGSASTPASCRPAPEAASRAPDSCGGTAVANDG